MVKRFISYLVKRCKYCGKRFNYPDEGEQFPDGTFACNKCLSG